MSTQLGPGGRVPPQARVRRGRTGASAVGLSGGGRRRPGTPCTPARRSPRRWRRGGPRTRPPAARTRTTPRRCRGRRSRRCPATALLFPDLAITLSSPYGDGRAAGGAARPDLQARRLRRPRPGSFVRTRERPCVGAGPTVTAWKRDACSARSSRARSRRRSCSTSRTSWRSSTGGRCSRATPCSCRVSTS